MTETWIPWCIKRAVPAGHAGYSNDPDRTLAEILYVVNHSAEGWKSYLINGYRPGESASWMFSNCQDGEMYQHFPLEALTYTSGSYEANRDGVGVEHEGVKGQPINEKQVANDRRLYADLRNLCPNLRAPQLGLGFREHRELTNGATTCPNGRIQPLYDSYREDDMAFDDDEKQTIRAIVDQALTEIKVGTRPQLDEMQAQLDRIEEAVKGQTGPTASNVAWTFTGEAKPK